jgi:hypothetical protein
MNRLRGATSGQLARTPTCSCWVSNLRNPSRLNLSAAANTALAPMPVDRGHTASDPDGALSYIAGPPSAFLRSPVDHRASR